MTQLVILSKKEKEAFDSPIKLSVKEKIIYFSLDQETIKLLRTLKTITNKVGFMLQLGYFRYHGKFFTANQFRKDDVDYVLNLLNLNAKYLNLDKYKSKIPLDHRKKILSFLNWNPLNKRKTSDISKYIFLQVENQLSPRTLFYAAVDYCWNNKIELPSYNQLAILITDSYNKHESLLINKTKKLLNKNLKHKLNLLVSTKNKSKFYKPPITFLKQVNQSLRPSQIKENINTLEMVKDYFSCLEKVIWKLSLSDQATEYYSTWVQKAETTQLSRFTNKSKLYLYLISYIKHQYYYRNDILIDIFIRSVQSIRNNAAKLLLESNKDNRTEKTKEIKTLSNSNKESRNLIESITKILKDQNSSQKQKLKEIETIIDIFNDNHHEENKKSIVEIEKSLDSTNDKSEYYFILESLSIKLQRRVSDIVKLLEFNIDNSDSNIMAAIEYFKSSDGNIAEDAPISFLTQEEQNIIFDDKKKIKVSLYKIMLFIKISDAIKSGLLNLKYSYRYKSIQQYLITEDNWNKNKAFILKNMGLISYENVDSLIDNLKGKLHSQYNETNSNFILNENKYMSVDQDNKIRISTPKISNSHLEYISGLLSNSGYVPILQILAEINKVTGFTKSFKHHSIKFNKMRPNDQVIYAGILGRGCNIGINKISNISVGITEGVLRNTVNWCFSLQNIQDANNKLVSMIEKLSLPNSFKKNKKVLHTGSDGRKVNVAVDSLNSNYSFKYFGKGKGSTMYTFLDERNALFHSTVISSSEREAAYVIDGLLYNNVLKSDIHSTDTHGFTETIFAITHFIETAFAPRFKNINNQTLYSFKSKSFYQNKGYSILPSRTINIKLIKDNWDDILRLIATIKLKHTTASVLLKRLSSYAKDHPLYRALKEFGRIIKSIFILTYFDQVELRQKIEKQLNKVELSNKFSKAIFFANNQEFQQGEKKEQEISTYCMVLIQNAIILWNYLYLSQLLVDSSNKEHREQILKYIKSGSAITWQHINLHGEYDFTRKVANDDRFNLAKIIELKLD